MGWGCGGVLDGAGYGGVGVLGGWQHCPVFVVLRLLFLDVLALPLNFADPPAPLPLHHILPLNFLPIDLPLPNPLPTPLPTLALLLLPTLTATLLHLLPLLIFPPRLLQHHSLPIQHGTRQRHNGTDNGVVGGVTVFEGGVAAGGGLLGGWRGGGRGGGFVTGARHEDAVVRQEGLAGASELFEEGVVLLFLLGGVVAQGCEEDIQESAHLAALLILLSRNTELIELFIDGLDPLTLTLLLHNSHKLLLRTNHILIDNHIQQHPQQRLILQSQLGHDNHKLLERILLKLLTIIQGEYLHQTRRDELHGLVVEVVVEELDQELLGDAGVEPTE